MNIIELFTEESLSKQLDSREAEVSSSVEEIPREEFSAADDQSLIDHIVSGLFVEPIVLQKDENWMEQKEAKVDASDDFIRRLNSGGRGPIHVTGTRVVIFIPFTGEEWIFKYQTNAFNSTCPFGEVSSGCVRFSISLPSNSDPEEFKTIYTRNMDILRKYVGHAHDQVSAYNNRLPMLAKEAVKRRRDHLGRHENISKLLNIPILKRPDAPSMEPTKLKTNRSPTLRSSFNSIKEAEPSIENDTYEEILHFIRHQGRTFELAPRTYSVHDEEGLRDIILSQLNGKFQGAAVGEAFRNKGKTDILIEQENRAAFVGECKIWTGPAGLSNALSQLLGYLTWRDSKAALIIFNKINKNFLKILDVIPGKISTHRLFEDNLLCGEQGEFRVRMKSPDDEDGRVTVHVFAFNLYRVANAKTSN